MTGVIMAAVVVGLIGLLIGLLLGFAAKAFAVPVDEKEIESFFREITAVVADMPDVMLWQRQLQQEKLL